MFYLIIMQQWRSELQRRCVVIAKKQALVNIHPSIYSQLIFSLSFLVLLIFIAIWIAGVLDLPSMKKNVPIGQSLYDMFYFIVFVCLFVDLLYCLMVICSNTKDLFTLERFAIVFDKRSIYVNENVYPVRDVYMTYSSEDLFIKHQNGMILHTIFFGPESDIDNEARRIARSVKIPLR